MGADCPEPGPQYSATNVDFMNVDNSTKDMVDEVENIHCSCNCTTILEWSVFEVATMVLLVCIFFWLVMGDGVSYCRSFLKNRGTKTQRLEKRLEAAKRKQDKLAQKMNSAAGLDVVTAHAPVTNDVEKKAAFSAV